MFEWQTNGWFWATVIIDLITVIIIVVLFIVHKALWERIYTSEEKAKKKIKNLNKKVWYNNECDK